MADARHHAKVIWQAAVDAVRPERLLRVALNDASLRPLISDAPRVLVVGAGKAGAAMARVVEHELADLGDRLTGVVNVPAQLVAPLAHIRLHAARPAGSNQPT